MSHAAGATTDFQLSARHGLCSKAGLWPHQIPTIPTAGPSRGPDHSPPPLEANANRAVFRRRFNRLSQPGSSRRRFRLPTWRGAGGSNSRCCIDVRPGRGRARRAINTAGSEVNCIQRSDMARLMDGDSPQERSLGTPAHGLQPGKCPPRSPNRHPTTVIAPSTATPPGDQPGGDPSSWPQHRQRCSRCTAMQR